MSPGPDAARARRYLLGQATEEERSALELEYFHSDEAVDRIAAAEDDLIEDYLSDRLDPVERGSFERDYLAARNHRRRVETIRQLLASTSRTEPGPAMDWSRQRLALAAALVLFAAGSLWVFTSSRGERGVVVEKSSPTVSTPPRSAAPSRPDQPPTTAPAAPRVFAVSISPVTVRSAAGAPAVIVPAGTDIVALSLEGEPDGRTGAGGRGSIRTVSGDEIWQGPATVRGDLPAGVIARLDVPAARLPPDDYVVTLFGTRYFLRVRAR
jgi:hypothetical protein